MINKKYFLGFVFVLVIIVTGCTNEDVKEINVGLSAVDRIYSLDPQRNFIGQDIGDAHFINIITNEQVHLDEIYKDKVVMIQSFSNGCPACVQGISEYNKLYQKYDIEVVYMDINPDDTPETIKAVKEEFNGRDWIWANYQGSLLPLYEKFNIKLNDMTFIIDKEGKIVYADSFTVPLERLENELNKLGV